MQSLGASLRKSSAIVFRPETVGFFLDFKWWDRDKDGYAVIGIGSMTPPPSSRNLSYRLVIASRRPQLVTAPQSNPRSDLHVWLSMVPTITTVIPTFRRPRLVERAIRSVLAQNFDGFQICVYDNASGDETAAVVAQIAREDPRVNYYCHPKNIGAWNNFKYGIERVSTPTSIF